MSRLFVEQLTVIDCAYLDAARGLVGESWIVDVELEGELDGQSMVLDFGEVKRRLKRGIDGSVDHSLLVPRQSPQLQLVERDERLQLQFSSALGVYEHHSPRSAVSLLDSAAVTPDAVIAYLQPRLRALLPHSVIGLQLSLRNEPISGAYYHYVHGLKKHAGLCQRIAHGHRSRIEVRIDGQRDAALEQAVAERWRDIYLGSREDLVARSSGRLRFAYTAAEGDYQLELPEARVDFLETDSTVEQIAAHLAQELAQQLAPHIAGKMLEVRAYEGYGKGAIASVENRLNG